MKIAIAGTGYVGFVTAVCLAEHGHQVTCVDVDKKKIDSLNRYGKALIYEKDLDALMEKNKARLTYTTDYASAYKDAEIIFIGVGTPEKRDGSANLNYVYAVAMQIAETAERECVVVVKSTVPIGTNERIEKLIKEHRPEGAAPLHVASNPEFLSQGTAVHDTLHASRIVMGVEDEYSKAKLTELYKDFAAPKIITNRRSAEMIKYASNDFLALKISYINEIANLCEEIGADIEDVAKGMGYDKRIGSKFLRAGIGYGGSCFPKDTKALHWLSDYHEQELKTVKAAIEVNDHQKLKLIRKAHKYYEDLEGVTVAVLGLTFKPGTDDLREAPSLTNVPLLLEEGAIVRVYDPVGMERFKEHYPTQVKYCKDIDNALDGADLCLILTDWPQIKEYPLEGFKRNMNKAIVLDGRNCYVLKAAEQTGIIYESVGRKAINIEVEKDNEYARNNINGDFQNRKQIELEQQKKLRCDIYDHIFPYHLFQEGETIAIYGAGDVGRKFYRQVKEYGWVKCVAIVDKNAEKINIPDIPVAPVEALKKFNFDKVLISMTNENYANEARENLIRMGIGEERIKWAGKIYWREHFYKHYWFDYLRFIQEMRKSKI